MKERMNMKTFKKVVIILGSLIVLAIAGLIFIFSWVGSPKEIVLVADQLKVSSSWKLESEMIRPPRMVCLDGGTCPEVSRVWKVSNDLSPQQFTNLVRESNWNFPIDGKCVLPKNAFGKDVSICSAEGLDKKYHVAIWLDEDSSPPHQQKLILSVRPE
jgi:hypothetical protein